MEELERTVGRMWSRTEEKEACGGGSGMWKSVEEEEKRLWWKWIDGMTKVEISRRIELGVCEWETVGVDQVEVCVEDVEGGLV